MRSTRGSTKACGNFINEHCKYPDMCGTNAPISSDISSLEIIPATPDDVSTLAAIGRQTFYETFCDTNTEENLERYLERNFNPDRVAEELTHPGSLFFMARIDGQVAGYLKVNTGDAQTEPQDSNAFEIERIYVKKTWYGKQVGQKLMDHALHLAREKQSTYVWLGVWEKNHRAIRFYKKYGFEVFDTHVFRIGNDAQTDYLMKLDIPV